MAHIAKVLFVVLAGAFVSPAFASFDDVEVPPKDPWPSPSNHCRNSEKEKWKPGEGLPNEEFEYLLRNEDATLFFCHERLSKSQHRRLGEYLNEKLNATEYRCLDGGCNKDKYIDPHKK